MAFYRLNSIIWISAFCSDSGPQRAGPFLFIVSWCHFGLYFLGRKPAGAALREKYPPYAYTGNTGLGRVNVRVNNSAESHRNSLFIDRRLMLFIRSGWHKTHIKSDLVDRTTKKIVDNNWTIHEVRTERFRYKSQDDVNDDIQVYGSWK